MRLGVDRLAERGILLVVHDLIEERIHEDDDLDILLDGFLEDVGLGLEDGVALLVLWLQELGVAGEKLVVQPSRWGVAYVLM
jgi:hypothetical protein